MADNQRAQFFTIADRRFFPGAVALLNSLYLTGNIGDLIVLDQGLTPEQRRSLERHATVVRIPASDSGHPMLAKAFPHVLGAEGTIVLIDSDMIVTSSMSDIISLAEKGRICVFPNYRTNQDRWFGEWQEIFGLPTVPRRQTYFNSGFLCFSTHHWPDLLRLYWEACQKIPATDVGTRESSDPISEADQDAMNALLMSVVPRGAIAELPSGGEAYRAELVRVRIVDERSLMCSLDGQPTTILHYSSGPKAWERRNWRRVRRDALTLLLPRVLFADDAPLKLPAETMPIWIRPGKRARVCLRLLDLAHRITAPPWRKVRQLRRSRGSRTES